MEQSTISEGVFRPRPGAVAPGLHLVSTPIGAARDITLRALDVLAGADVLAAEDTRTLRHLMEIHGIALNGRPLVAVHDHNEAGVAGRIVAALREGKSVAYASEAGTPLISDPGFVLARAAVAAGQPVLAAPGASALLAALAVAGLPADRFLFAGFPPSARGERQRFLQELASTGATLVLYESPRRLRGCLAEMAVSFGAMRQVAVCRELTKRHEEVLRGTITEVIEMIGEEDPKGEIVLVVDRAPPKIVGEAEILAALQQALLTMRVKDAASFVADTLQVPRREVYQLALAQRQEE
ncbi:16S rRNA (cytidine(1402)-2'-O)-methyltransferase [Pseudogemmobacter faecipullorum]|uniref:Ribosomal RNA small subunit methyltransferase I n=1 Tax=Pseudogemmobacter faecipullorum TaxID=2755041 RepID=A0ABS8CI20_9RHOB|nr:16S rRNA (cytidine(1402)-2'-O)-methyltransferase [Pseudogemmobacter faecipullorum]MCB5409024.1 16S rRNA (cytidine(1402)-2'-O)-methyltransferase [Pseudogemmobacter faecipullorum]